MLCNTISTANAMFQWVSIHLNQNYCCMCLVYLCPSSCIPWPYRCEYLRCRAYLKISPVSFANGLYISLPWWLCEIVHISALVYFVKFLPFIAFLLCVQLYSSRLCSHVKAEPCSKVQFWAVQGSVLKYHYSNIRPDLSSAHLAKLATSDILAVLCEIQ